MAITEQQLFLHDSSAIPDASKMRIGIIVSQWNQPITEKLLDGARNTLEKLGVSPDNMPIFRVPGSFELTFGAQQLAKYGDVDAIIVLGCVIRGETSHYDYVCKAVTEGITRLNATQDIPVIFGLLTTENMQQAEDRAGGKSGNKGEESAITAIKMIDFICKLKK